MFMEEKDDGEGQGEGIPLPAADDPDKALRLHLRVFPVPVRFGHYPDNNLYVGGTPLRNGNCGQCGLGLPHLYGYLRICRHMRSHRTQAQKGLNALLSLLFL